MSGRSLIDSFLRFASDKDHLLVCYEDMITINPDPRITVYNLDNCKYLHDWLHVNHERIPEMYGGGAGDDHPIVKQFKEETGQYWANHRASRYFRKVAALHCALNNAELMARFSDITVIDADCIIRGPLVNLHYDVSFDVGFFWGKHRRSIDRGPETGFVIYRGQKGIQFAKSICECFGSQDFLNFTYWDDGYVIGRLIKKHTDDYNFYDFVGNSDKRTTRVMEIKEQPLYGIIHHFKNRHQTSV
tara:strand:- start:112 stop:846 length:735 start_codon:yes stop_codon:yes gene_type:complete